MDTLPALLKRLAKNHNTLLDIPLHFDGEYGEIPVQRFIDYIEAYKRIKCISDEQALHELGHLLKEHAYNWWHRRKCQLQTWSEAITALQNQFSKQRQAHIVYRHIFKHRLEEYSSMEDFIDDKYELFNELPHPKPTERQQVDMVYAMLPRKYHERIKYIKVRNLLDLRENVKQCNIRMSQFKESETQNELRPESARRTENMQMANNADTNANNGTVTAKRKSMDCSGDNSNEGREPVIKVRRTEDLMPPQVKEEDQDEIEFISDKNDNIGSNLNGSGNNNASPKSSKEVEEMQNFQIDSEIMTQINNIINESELEAEMQVQQQQQPQQQPRSIISLTHCPPIAYLLNGETTIAPEFQYQLPSNMSISKITEEKVSAAGAVGSRKNKIRCSYCRKFNHKAESCLKRQRDRTDNPERYQKLWNKERENEMLETKTDDQQLANNDCTEITLVSSQVVENPSMAESSSVMNATISGKMTSNSPAPILNSSTVTIATSSPTLRIATPPPLTSTTTKLHATLNSPTTVTAAASASSCSTAVTVLTPAINTMTSTKLIAPINGPSKITAAAKLRSNLAAGPAPKCHQCGTVGFYKSICPNCSPIYNLHKHS